MMFIADLLGGCPAQVFSLLLLSTQQPLRLNGVPLNGNMIERFDLGSNNDTRGAPMENMAVLR